MKRLADFRRITFAILAMFLTANLWGQAPRLSLLKPSESNSETNPYLINNTTDWNNFATDVTNGYSYSEEYVRLTANITIYVDNDTDRVPSDKIAGSWTSDAVYNPFSGTFDGNWYTITFNVGLINGAYIPEESSSKPLPSAPFRVIDGATINNLHVTGKIVSTKKYNSGLVGFAYSTKTTRYNYINNCTSSIIIDCSSIVGGNSDCSVAGFLAENKANGKTVFKNCVFNGKIDKGDLSSGDKCGGFVSFNNGTSLAFTNCTMDGEITFTGSNKANFYRSKDATLTEAYRTKNNYGGQGTQAPSEGQPDDKIVKKYIYGSTTYYVPGAEITGLETTTYSYIEDQTIPIDAPVVSYYGRTLTRGEDYVIKKKYGEGDWAQVDGDITLSEAGEYKIKIEAKEGSSYGGSKTTTIKVINFNSWSIVKEYLADASKGDRNITLSDNIFPENPSGEDVALEVNGNVVLDLHGKIIDRRLYKVENGEVTINTNVEEGYAIHVNSTAKLTIKGSGSITGGNNHGNGGGIYNEGNLVLNNVTVEYNNTERVDASITGTGGGIYSESGSSLIINNGYIRKNDGKGGGGGIHSKGHPFTMKNVEVSDNISEDKGGGIRVAPPSNKTDTIIGCYIHDNHTTNQTESKGGGVYMNGESTTSKLYMEDCRFYFNSAYVYGGAFYSIKGTTYAKNCTMILCVAYNETGVGVGYALGGSIYLYSASGISHDSEYTMDGGEITLGIAEINGGGVYVCEGAIFNVLGNVKIYDNVVLDWEEGYINNSVYLDKTAKIHVVGDLGDDAIINITPHGGGGVAVEFAEGASSGNPAEDLSHFQLDGSDYNIIIDDDGNIESYVPSAWNDTDTWEGTIAENSSGAGTVPTSGSTVWLHRAVKIPSGFTANAGTIICDDFCDIIIEDGAQLITNSADVAVLAKKEIVAADADAHTGWYLISAPVANPNIADNTNLITLLNGTYGIATYDLYRYNEAADMQWENYRAGHGDFTTLENGRGYLYRNYYARTIDIGGTLDVSSVSYALSYHATTSPSGNANALQGFNIIGNPYSHNIQKGTNTDKVTYAINNGDLLEDGYYVLNSSTGAFVLTADGEIIPPLTGILVQAKSASTLTINKVVASGSKGVKADNAEIQFTVSNSDFEDKAFVKFKEGHGLNKIEHLNEEAPMLYIHHNGEDFASVDMSDNTKQFNLNLEAKTTGKYTLSVEPQGAYKYLHLIDRLAEKDIDLLAEKEYSFIGSSADNADRFIVRLEHSDNVDSSVFAYQSGNEIVVSGEGELQIFDVMGRLVMQKHVSGVEAVEKPMATGVYVLKLNENIQKIIVK